MKKIISFIKDSDGASAIEYSIVAGLIAVVLVSSLTSTGAALSGYFQSIVTALS